MIEIRIIDPTDKSPTAGDIYLIKEFFETLGLNHFNILEEGFRTKLISEGKETTKHIRNKKKRGRPKTIFQLM